MIMVCLKHPDREAAAVCAACGKPLCSECILHADNADYCSESCHCKGVEAKKRSVDIIRSTNEYNRKNRRKGLLKLLVIIIILVAGWFFYQQYRKQIHNKIDNVTATAKEGAGEAINAGKGAMPQDSKYKRERESLVK